MKPLRLQKTNDETIVAQIIELKREIIQLTKENLELLSMILDSSDEALKGKACKPLNRKKED